jgi:hypothetical protein
MTLFLRAVLVLVGIVALAFLLIEPHFEGRNAHATPFQVYFEDPFLAYAYVASIPFFAGLYHAIKVVGYIGKNSEVSPSTVRSVRIIKYCAIALIVFVAGAEVFIVTSDSDDHAGGVFIGVVIAFASIVVAITAAVIERAMQKAVKLRS